MNEIECLRQKTYPHFHPVNSSDRNGLLFDGKNVYSGMNEQF